MVTHRDIPSETTKKVYKGKKLVNKECQQEFFIFNYNLKR
jgi:hypothetical protein